MDSEGKPISINKEIVKKYKDFLEFERSLKPKTVGSYLNNLALISDKIDVLAVKHRTEVVGAIKQIKKERGWGQKATTTWRCSHDLCYFYKWATMDGIIPFNPYPFNMFRKPQANSVEFITSLQFSRIMENDMHFTHQDKLLLWVFWDTALRREELQKLDREDFNLKKGIIFLPEEKSKGSYGQRHVAMSETTKNLLIEQFKLLDKAGVDTHVFCGDNYKRINADQIYKRIIRAGKVIPGQYIKLSPRIMRHSLAVRLLEAGASDLEIQMTLGHANKEMTRRYAHSVESFAKGIRDKYLDAI